MVEPENRGQECEEASLPRGNRAITTRENVGSAPLINIELFDK